MPYVFGETQTGEKRSAQAFPSLTSEVLTETFAQTYEENPVASIGRALELRKDYQTGEKLSAESARAKLKDRGLDSHLKVSDAGITQAALDTLMFRKGVELRRQEVFQQAEGGVGQTAARLGVGLATSLIDPINVGTAFIPVIGEARYAQILGRAGGLLSRTAIRTAVGAAEGVAGAAMVEPIIAGSRRYEQADYDMGDSLLNVAFGGLFGAGLHSTFGAVSDGLRHYHQDVPRATVDTPRRVEPTVDGARTPEYRDPIPEPGTAASRVAEASPIAQQNALKQAIVQAVTNEPVNVGPIAEGLPKIKAEINTGGLGGLRRTTPLADVVTAPLLFHETDFASLRNLVSEDLQPNQRQMSLYLTDDPHLAIGQGGEGVTLSFRTEAMSGKEHAKPGTGIIGGREYLADAAAPSAIDKIVIKDGAAFERIDPDKISAIESNVKWMLQKHFDQKKLNDGSIELTPKGREQTRADIDPEDTIELPALIEQAEEVIARETDTGTPTADNLKMATEEFSLAQSDLQSLADRLGMEAEDADLTAVYEAAKMSERWAKASELATVCLMRGG